MKRQGILKIAGALFVAVLIILLGAFTLFWRAKPPGALDREMVSSFNFTSSAQLDKWEQKALAPKETEYSRAKYEGADCVKAVSEDSASALYYRQRLSCERDPFVSWDWKASAFPGDGLQESLSEKKKFDFVAQFYVIFHARFFLNAKAIQYVWTHDIPVGTAVSSPYTKNVKLLVLESGASETWKHEERDIKEDYRMLFGEELEKDVVAVSFMTDSDSTDTAAEAYYSNIALGYLAKTGEDGPEGRPGTGSGEAPKRGTEIEVKKKTGEEKEQGPDLSRTQQKEQSSDI